MLKNNDQKITAFEDCKTTNATKYATPSHTVDEMIVLIEQSKTNKKTYYESTSCYIKDETTNECKVDIEMDKTRKMKFYLDVETMGFIEEGKKWAEAQKIRYDDDTPVATSIFNSTQYVLNRAFNLLFPNEKIAYAVNTAHKDNYKPTDPKKGYPERVSKISFHIYAINVIMTKAQMKSVRNYITKLVKTGEEFNIPEKTLVGMKMTAHHTFDDYFCKNYMKHNNKTLPQMIDSLYDDGVYSSGRSMRMLNTSKPNENRPLVMGESENKLVNREQQISDTFINYWNENTDEYKILVAPDNTDELLGVSKSTSTSKSSSPLIANTQPNSKISKDTDELFEQINDLVGLGHFQDFYSGTHPKWVEFIFMMLNSFGEVEGSDLIRQFANEYCSANKQAELETTLADAITRTRNCEEERKITFASAFKEIKEQHPADWNIVLRNRMSRRNVFASDDVEASKIMLQKVGERVKSCQVGGEVRIFYRADNNCWIYDIATIETHLLHAILNSKIYRPIPEKSGKKDEPKLIPYAQNVSQATNILKALMNKIYVEKHDDGFYEKLRTSTKGKICFQDGVLDFVEQSFTTWETLADNKTEIYTTVLIPRNYEEYFSNPDTELVEKLRNTIYIPLFGKEKYELALQFLSRGIAGYIDDKNWAMGKGRRDCGKGVCYENLKHGFGEYVTAFSLDNILCDRDNERALKPVELYWLLELEFARLAISQETPANTHGLKLSGKLMKSLTSGGDTQRARRNYDKRDTSFKVGATLMIFGNSYLECSVADVMEHRLDFNSECTFKLQSEIDEAKELYPDQPLMYADFRVKDPLLKGLCATEAYANAIVYLLYKSFTKDQIKANAEAVNDDDNDGCMKLREELLEKLCFADKNSEILARDVETLFSKYHKTDVQSNLQSMGIRKVKSNKGKEFRNKMVYIGVTIKPTKDDTTLPIS